MRGACQMLPDPNWKAEDQPETLVRTSGGNTMTMMTRWQICLHCSWMFKEESSQGETKKITPKKGDSKKKPVQPKKKNITLLDRVQGGTTGEKCVEGPVMGSFEVE